MEENNFTIDTDKIRTMSKDVAAVEREEKENLTKPTNLQSKKENIISQLQKEKAAIQALAEQEKEREAKDKLNLNQGQFIDSVFEPTSATPTIPTTIPQPNGPIKINLMEGGNGEIKDITHELKKEASIPSPPKEEMGVIKADLPNLSSEKEQTIHIPKPSSLETKEKPVIKPEYKEPQGLSVEELKEFTVMPQEESQIEIGEIQGLPIDLLEPQPIEPKELNLEDAVESEETLLEEMTGQSTELTIEELNQKPTISLEELSPKLKKDKSKNIQKQAESLDLEDNLITSQKQEDPKEKLRKLTDLIFELEQNLEQIAEEKIPFEERKKDIEREIAKSKERLDLISERLKKIDEIKKRIEAQEATATTIEEKRNLEKERWKVEDERNAVEEEKNKKEDELKSLRLQLNEFNISYEKILAREKELNLELSSLKRDKENLLLQQEKNTLLPKLEEIQTEANNIRELMADNSAQKESIEKRINDIAKEEKSIEEEIRTLEKRVGLTVPEVEVKKIEKSLKDAEEKRRAIEQKRWEAEDELERCEKIRADLRNKYQYYSAEAQKIKNQIMEINKKIIPSI